MAVIEAGTFHSEYQLPLAVFFSLQEDHLQANLLPVSSTLKAAKGGLGYQPGQNTALVPVTQKPWMVPLYQQFYRGEFIQGHDQITPLLPPEKVARPAYRDTLGSLRPRKKLKTIKTANEYEEWEDIGELAQALSQLFLHKDLPSLLEFPVDTQSDTSEE